MSTTPTDRKVVIDSKVLESLSKINKARESVKAATKPTAPELAPTAPTYNERMKPCSLVYGIIPQTIDHAVPVFKDTDWPEAVRHLIPDVDPSYIFPREQLEEVLAGLWTHRDNAFAHGPKGSGKSTLFQQIAARQRLPFVRVNCRLDMESSAIFGSVVFDPAHGITWRDGPAAELGLAGGILCVDEISQIPAGIAMSMQYMLERNGRIYLADKPGGSSDKTIVPHEFFRLVATDNTQLQGDNTGHYVGAQIQNEALIDRFGTTVLLDYLGQPHERAVLKNRVPGCPDNWITDMLNVAAQIRAGYDQGTLQMTLSPRGLINWAEKAVYWGDSKRGFSISHFSKCVESDKKLLREIWKKITSEEMA